MTLLRLRQPAQEYNTIVLILDPTLLDTDPPSQLQCLKEFEDVALFHKKGQHKSESVYLFCCRRFTQQALATSIYRQLQKEWDSPGRISFLQSLFAKMPAETITDAGLEPLSKERTAVSLKCFVANKGQDALKTFLSNQDNASRAQKLFIVANDYPVSLTTAFCHFCIDCLISEQLRATNSNSAFKNFKESDWSNLKALFSTQPPLCFNFSAAKPVFHLKAWDHSKLLVPPSFKDDDECKDWFSQYARQTMHSKLNYTCARQGISHLVSDLAIPSEVTVWQQLLVDKKVKVWLEEKMKESKWFAILLNVRTIANDLKNFALGSIDIGSFITSRIVTPHVVKFNSRCANVLLWNGIFPFSNPLLLHSRSSGTDVQTFQDQNTVVVAGLRKQTQANAFPMAIADHPISVSKTHFTVKILEAPVIPQSSGWTSFGLTTQDFPNVYETHKYIGHYQHS